MIKPAAGVCLINFSAPGEEEGQEGEGEGKREGEREGEGEGKEGLTFC